MKSFSDFLSATLAISNFVKLKVKYEKAIVTARDNVDDEKRQKEFQLYSARILAKYDFFKAKGISIREAIRATKEFFNKSGNYITCYQIEQIARKAGRLSKRKNRGTP